MRKMTVGALARIADRSEMKIPDIFDLIEIEVGRIAKRNPTRTAADRSRQVGMDHRSEIITGLTDQVCRITFC